MRAGNIFGVTSVPTSTSGEVTQLDLAALAELSGVSARTIRYYQAERLLPAPFSDPDDGRVARYGSAHLRRLELIGDLQERGLKLAAIRELIANGDDGRSIPAWLGLHDHFRGWTDTAPLELSHEEFAERTVGVTDTGVEVLIDAGLIERSADGVTFTSPALVDTSLDLLRTGMDPAMVMGTGRLLRHHLAAAADELVSMFASVFDSGDVEFDIAALGDVFRTHAARAAGTTFAEELERASSEAIADRRGDRTTGPT